jgi:hypothetical protein
MPRHGRRQLLKRQDCSVPVLLAPQHMLIVPHALADTVLGDLAAREALQGL